MLIKKSFIELRARERAKALLDSGSFRELLGPFDFIESPWLEKQNIVPQADDGMVIAKGTFGGKACCVAAIEGAFQGGSMGEVSGAKMAAMLEFDGRPCFLSDSGDNVTAGAPGVNTTMLRQVLALSDFTTSRSCLRLSAILSFVLKR